MPDLLKMLEADMNQLSFEVDFSHYKVADRKKCLSTIKKEFPKEEFNVYVLDKGRGHYYVQVNRK